MYPLMPSCGPHELVTDRSILSRPSMNVVMSLLEQNIELKPNEKGLNLAGRLVSALSACSQISSLGAYQRMWALQRLRRLIRSTPELVGACIIAEAPICAVGPGSISKSSSYGSSAEQSPSKSMVEHQKEFAHALRPVLAISKGLKGIPELLLKQYDYEEPVIRTGKHLMFSPFFKVNQFCWSLEK